MAVNSTHTPLASGEQLVDLTKLFAAIGRYNWRIILLAIVSAICAALIAQNMTPIYRSTATLLIEAQAARAIKIEEVYGFNSSQEEYYLTQFEILKSRSIAERVYDELSLAGHPALQSKPTLYRQAMNFVKTQLGIKEEVIADSELSSALTRKRRLDGFSRSIQISPVRKTRRSGIGGRSDMPVINPPSGSIRLASVRHRASSPSP